MLARDRQCVAALLGHVHVCRDMWGLPHPPDALMRLTLDHVNDQPTLGKRAPSDPAHLAAICYGEHLGGWATAHRPELRDYLRRVNAA